jgi:hypothetical protein
MRKLEEILSKYRFILLQVGFLVLLCQNVGILGIFGTRDPFSFLYIFIIFNFDMIGFSILTLGYYGYFLVEKSNRNIYFLATLFFFFWVLIRLINQYIAPFLFDFSLLRERFSFVPDLLFVPFLYNLHTPSGFESPPVPLPPLFMVILYLLNAAIFFGAFFCCAIYPLKLSEHKKPFFSAIFSFLYIVLNFISVFLHGLPFIDPIVTGAYPSDGLILTGGILKISLVPLVGIVTFSSLFLKIRAESSVPLS